MAILEQAQISVERFFELLGKKSHIKNPIDLLNLILGLIRI